MSKDSFSPRAHAEISECDYSHPSGVFTRMEPEPPEYIREEILGSAKSVESVYGSEAD